MDLRRLIVFLVAAVLLPSVTAVDSAPKNVLVKVQTWVDGMKNIKIVGLGARFGTRLASNEKNAYRFALTHLDPQDGSAPKNKLGNDIIMVNRGNCACTTKANNAVAAGASAVLIINNEKELYNMVCYPDETDLGIHIPAVMLPQDAGLSLMKLLSNSSSVSVQLYSPKRPLVDIADVLVWLMAVGTMLYASYWSAWAAIVAAIEQDKLPKGPEGEILNGSTQGSGGIVNISKASAIIFVLVAAYCLLIILYKLISSSEPIPELFLVVAAIGGAKGLETCLVALLSRWFRSSAESYIKVPVFGAISHLTLAVSPFCVIFAALWEVYHHLSFAWIGQDILGIAFMITVLRIVRIPNLKVGTLVLSCVFLFDILLVFLVKKLFPECVVIADLVAHGGKIGESRTPKLLKLPRLFDPWGGYSFIVFDDLFLPGLVAAFSLRYDWQANKNLRAGYFLWVMFASGIGIVITLVARKLIDAPHQPALLYMAPLTLGIFLALGKKRGDLKVLWTMGDQVSDQHIQSKNLKIKMEDSLADS